MTDEAPFNAIDLDALRDNPAFEVARICQIDTRDLDRALMTQAGLAAYAYSLHESARAAEQEAKYAYERAKAEEFSRLRDGGAAIGQANEQAELGEAVSAARQAAMAKEATTRQYYALVRGLEQRRDMLIQLSARQRQEMRSFE